MPKAFDLAGKKFGRLIAVRQLYKDNQNNWIWLFRCDCGGLIEAIGSLVNRGETQSCGCLQRERTSQANFKHGGSGGHHPLYQTWAGMLARCRNPKHKDYRYYGGRGITVCERWRDFRNFVVDVWPKPSPLHTLDRIDGSKNYCPDNCRWATPHEQRMNCRPRQRKPIPK